MLHKWLWDIALSVKFFSEDFYIKAAYTASYLKLV